MAGWGQVIVGAKKVYDAFKTTQRGAQGIASGLSRFQKKMTPKAAPKAPKATPKVPKATPSAPKSPSPSRPFRKKVVK